MKILLVEDDENIVIPVEEFLSEQNYIVEVANDGQTAWELIDVFDYDLILLDVMLPKIKGTDLCRKLRAKSYKKPILMLTAMDTVNDKITGLDAGADDYLVKPFDYEELSARIRALLRRGESSLPPVLTWGGELSLDPSTCEVFYKQEKLNLSPKEYRLLEFFLRHPRQVFERGQILDHLWSMEQLPEEATVKAHISSLRQKLKKAGMVSDVIETVYGIGYRLKESP